MSEQLTAAEAIADLRDHLAVATMCHCDEPDECDDHWELFLVSDPASVPEDGHIGRARTLTPEHMRALVNIVAVEASR